MVDRTEFHLRRIDGNKSSETMRVCHFAESSGPVAMSRRSLLAGGLTIAAALGALQRKPRGLQAAEFDDLVVDRRSAVFAHTDAVTALSFSPDGKILASGSKDCTVKLWNMDTRRLKLVLPQHDDGVTDVAFSHDGRHLASVSKVIRVSTLVDGNDVWSRHAGGPGLTSVVGLSDNTTFVSGSVSGEVVAWKLPAGERRRLLLDPSASVRDLAVAADGHAIVTAGRDGNLRFWSTDDGRMTREAGGHATSIEAVAFSPDGRTVAAGGRDQLVTIRSAADPDDVRTLAGHAGPVQDVAFVGNASFLASAGADGEVRLWTVPEGTLVATLRCAFPLFSLAVSSDGAMLAAGDARGIITLWDLRGRRLGGFLFDEKASAVAALIYDVRDETTHRTTGYTYAAKEPLPAGAVCICNTVPGKLVRTPAVVASRPPSDAREKRESRAAAAALLHQQSVARKQARAEAQRMAAMAYYAQLAYLEALEWQGMGYGRPRADSSSSSTCTCNQVCTCVPVSY